MKRRSMLSLVFVVVVTLALVSPVWAGGVVVSLDSSPTDVRAGVPFDVGFTIMSAHDGSAFSDLRPMVIATNASTGETITVTAEDARHSGHYVASLTLPVEGTWEWGVQAFGTEASGEPLRMMTPLQVREPAGGLNTPNANTIAFDAALPIIALIVTAALITMLGLVRLRRRAVAH